MSPGQPQPLPSGRRILLCGGAGFVGSHLAALLASDNELTVLDDLSSGRREHLPESRHGVRLVVGDVRDSGVLASVVPGHDLVFHLAVRSVRHAIRDAVTCAEVNSLGTLQVALACARASIRRLIYVSSSEVYGVARQGEPPAPTTAYASSKLAGEYHASAIGRMTGLPVTIVRPFNAYGPRCHLSGMSAEVIPRFALRLRANRPLPVFGDGSQRRAFTWAGDIAEGIARAASSHGALAGPFDLAFPETASVREIGVALARRLPGANLEWRTLPARPGDPDSQTPDPEPARRALGFEARTTLADGLDRFLAWLEEAVPDPTPLLEAESAETNW